MQAYTHPEGMQLALSFSVGGTLFHTTHATVQRAPPQLQALILGPDADGTGFTRDPTQGVPFVDADAQLFRHVLAYLRRGTLPEGLNAATLEALAQEASYLHMPHLATAASQRAAELGGVAGTSLTGLQLEQYLFARACHDKAYMRPGDAQLRETIFKCTDMFYKEFGALQEKAAAAKVATAAAAAAPPAGAVG